MTISLSQLKKGQIATIQSYNENDLSLQTLLMGIGILPGDNIEIASSSILGSPITIKYGQGELLAIRTKQAKMIQVIVSG